MKLLEYFMAAVASMLIIPIISVWTVEYFWEEADTWYGKLNSILLGLLVPPIATSYAFYKVVRE